MDTKKIIKKRVLIVEDDLLLARMYQKKFDIENFQADIVTRGREAISKARDNYDVIILDILLPEIDGFEILKEWKSKEETKKIPVLILTNLGTSQVLIREGMKLGAEDYFIKSKVSAQDVIDKVKKILKKK
ncbi:MAG: response regulator transcription factor [bacterium]